MFPWGFLNFPRILGHFFITGPSPVTHPKFIGDYCSLPPPPLLFPMIDQTHDKCLTFSRSPERHKYMCEEGQRMLGRVWSTHPDASVISSVWEKMDKKWCGMLRMCGGFDSSSLCVLPRHLAFSCPPATYTAWQVACPNDTCLGVFSSSLASLTCSAGDNICTIQLVSGRHSWHWCELYGRFFREHWSMSLCILACVYTRIKQVPLLSSKIPRGGFTWWSLHKIWCHEEFIPTLLFNLWRVSVPLHVTDNFSACTQGAGDIMFSGCSSMQSCVHPIMTNYVNIISLNQIITFLPTSGEEEEWQILGWSMTKYWGKYTLGPKVFPNACCLNYLQS